MVSRFDARACDLGEGAFWHPLRKQFFWFDITGCRMLSAGLEWRFDRMASAAGWIDADRLLIATETDLSVMDLRDGVLRHLAPLEADNPVTRSNDGRADRQGGFWVGTMGKNAEGGAGTIYRWYRGKLSRMYVPVTIPNAICFAPDGRTAYFADTEARRIWAQPLDGEGWPVDESRVFLDLNAEGLNPDGAIIDAAGGMWLACWGDGAVRRFDAQGRQTDRLDVPALHVSCPALGGDDMRDLMLTSARQGLDDPDPVQGQTWMLRAAIPGLPEPQVVL